jgi:hypothetical protein
LTRIGVGAGIVDAGREGAAVNTSRRNIGINRASVKFQIGGLNASRIDYK